VGNTRLGAVLEHHAARARIFFDRAIRALAPEDRRSFLPAEIMRAVYFNLLQRIEAAGFDVFSGRVRVPRPAQARLAVVLWWRSRATPRVDRRSMPRVP
jgi:phytoene synthase